MLARTTPGYANWSTVRTEYYGYDADFDYLTDVDYNDGLSNEVQTWGYDAAGNRISASAKVGSWTYDNLNRMTASPGATYEHDAVGNRTYKETPSSGDESYYWDRVNRLIGISSGIAGWDSEFTYRADGMRVKKEVGDGTTTILTRSYYDGQMPVEEDVNDGSSVKLTRSFVGARGIEAMTVDSGSGAVTSYPLYDTHGNMIATVRSLSGGTAWDIYDERNYDVWGGVRQGNTTGGPKGRYVANLGHVQDDESGLIYMRARYYEPETGRFINEDSVRQGVNWYTYCKSNPVNFVDSSGNWIVPALWILAAILGALIGAAVYQAGEYGKGQEPTTAGTIAAAVAGAATAVIVIAAGLWVTGSLAAVSAAALGTWILIEVIAGMFAIGIAGFGGWLEAALSGLSMVSMPVAAVFGRSMQVLFELMEMDSQ
ncbi:MAG: RHS repeat-associated core domain-containing protein [Fimbriimonadaceae bacterium]|nr:MAG: RHS repeat-associated core domain-containing protein [Fimbriimonadaceae bacterium]